MRTFQIVVTHFVASFVLALVAACASGTHSGSAHEAPAAATAAALDTHAPGSEAEAKTIATPEPVRAPASLRAPQELFEIVKVVDGDTIHVRRAGQIEKLRLLCVDTEEKLSGGASSPTKPATVFGEECALWAQKLFADLAHDGKPAAIGLAFPGEVEQRDVYGRLLCYVTLPDGTDYNLMLVKLGKSPYFTKYGVSEVNHELYVSAQRAARAKGLGIWNAQTNVAKTAGVPSARRPYERLLPWWDARGEAVDAFRARRKASSASVFDAESSKELERASSTAAEVEIFGEVGQVFEETSGDATVLFRAENKDQALRVRIPRSARAMHESLDLEGLTQEFRQNYVWFRGKIARGGRGFQAVSVDAAAWKRAGPEPKMPTSTK